jgi:hypothetical protein
LPLLEIVPLLLLLPSALPSLDAAAAAAATMASSAAILDCG